MPGDLYSQWLDVAPGPRPPDHYTLLGLPAFCDDAASIEQAARTRLARLDRYAIHPDPGKRDACHRLMNEVARARVVLVSPSRKSAYDSQLAEALGVTLRENLSVLSPDIQVTDESANVEAESYLDDLAQAARQATPLRQRTRKASRTDRAVAWAVAGFLLFAAIASWLILRSTEHRQSGSPQPVAVRSGPAPLTLPAQAPQPNATTTPPTPIVSKIKLDASRTVVLARTVPLGGFGSYRLELNDDGTKLVALANNQARFFSPATGDAIGSPLSLGDGPPQINEARPYFLDYSRRRIISLTGDGRDLRAWDIRSRQQIGPIIQGRQMFDADLSPNGSEWVTSNAPVAPRIQIGTATLWDAASAKPIGAELHNHIRIQNARFSPDGQRVVAASLDGFVQIFDARTGERVGIPFQYPPPDTAQIAIFSPAGDRIVSLSRGGVLMMLDWKTGIDFWRAKLAVLGSALGYSPDGRLIVAGGRSAISGSHGSFTGIQIFDARTGNSVTSLLRHDEGEYSLGPETTFAFSPNGRYLVTTSCLGHTARLWDLGRGGALAAEPIDHPRMVCSAIFDATGQRIITACADGNMRIWKLIATSPPIAAAPAPIVSPGRVAPPKPADPLAAMNAALNQITDWTVEQGVWDFVADGKLHGEGASDIDFDPDLPPNATISFRMCVVKGMRPRIHFDGPGIYVGNEGYSKKIQVHGKAKDLSGDPLDYKNGDEIAVRVSFIGDDRFEARLNDHVLTGKCLPHGKIHLRLSGGDWWSKGTTDFWDMHVADGGAPADHSAEKRTKPDGSNKLFDP